ncbi:MAG TPA: glucose-1-phosphate adenylyltransferase [Armatimonadetes bacterium]|nr:glucose-1-phosphate adenylyltransferase [Armatimonadota bacterium]
MGRKTLLDRAVAMLMAGGQGERLYPLTKDRAKPAVPFGGVYRIIDFTLSNCLNSGLRRIFVLTQYKSVSLHRHVLLAWNMFNYELGEYINLVPPQRRIGGSWYRGTADAIYQNIYLLEQERPDYVVILSGDHVYKMDYGPLLEFHVKKRAELTVACVEVPRKEASRLGVMEIDADCRVVGFQEKPADPKPLPDDPHTSLGSMGVYVFNTPKLVRVLTEDARTDSEHDFGKNIIPGMVAAQERVYAYRFQDENRNQVKYWRDIGTIDSYYEANMDLVGVTPVFNLYDKDWPIRTYHPQLPPAKIVHTERPGEVLNSLVANGCIVSGGRVAQSILSPGVHIHTGAEVTASILLEGVDVGRGARVHRAVVDKEVRIPPGDAIGLDPQQDRRRFKVTAKGIVVVPRGIILQK